MEKLTILGSGTGLTGLWIAAGKHCLFEPSQLLHYSTEYLDAS